MAKSSYKTEWDFSDIYAGPNDPNIESDTQEIEHAYADFAKKYALSDSYLISSQDLSSALMDWEKMCEKAMMWKPGWYLSIILEKDSGNDMMRALLNKLSNRLTQAANQILFFELKLATISPERQKLFLENPLLERFQYFLERIFLTARYNLSEAEEKIINLKRQTSYDMWIDAQSKYENAQEIVWRGKRLPISKAVGMIGELPTKSRYKLRSFINKKLKEISFLAEAEMNAIITNKKIDDSLRKASKPYELTVIGYQNNLASIEKLVEIVTDNFSICHRFYSLKRKLLKLKSLRMADTAIGIGKIKMKLPFDRAVSLVKESFRATDPQLETIFDNMIQNGRIDVYPKKGKSSGAFCSSGNNVPTSILLNQVDTLDSYTTLAHEMGHAIHAELSKNQPILYRGHTISVAEVASTFFENIAFEHVFNSLSDKEKTIVLFDRLQDDMSTVFRQIAFFNYENEIHTLVREKGSLTKEEYARLYVKHLKSYIGNAMEFDADDGYSFVYISHFRRFFYVYSYAYGQLISKALYAKYKENPNFITQIKQFLSAGESMSPENIFKSIGIDTSDSKFFESGLRSIEADIARLEKLTNKWTK